MDEKGGMNLYQMVGNSPANSFDEHGLYGVNQTSDDRPGVFRKNDSGRLRDFSDLFTASNSATSKHTRSMFFNSDKIYNDANRRRGRGPWKNSAQHCWLNCYIAHVYGGLAGAIAAGVTTAAEFSSFSSDGWRDIAANIAGAAAGTAATAGKPSPFWAGLTCDLLCFTL